MRFSRHCNRFGELRLATDDPRCVRFLCPLLLDSISMTTGAITLLEEVFVAPLAR